MTHWIRHINQRLARRFNTRPGRRPLALRFQPKAPTPAECRLLAASALAMLGLLAALAWTCQASMARGERLRAEQRAQPAPGVETIETGRPRA